MTQRPQTTTGEDHLPADNPPPAPGRVRVAVHNGRCHHFGICVHEAPDVFALRG
jgi:hypothetical protein